MVVLEVEVAMKEVGELEGPAVPPLVRGLAGGTPAGKKGKGNGGESPSIWVLMIGDRRGSESVEFLGVDIGVVYYWEGGELMGKQ